MLTSEYVQVPPIKLYSKLVYVNRDFELTDLSLALSLRCNTDMYDSIQVLTGRHHSLTV